MALCLVMMFRAYLRLAECLALAVGLLVPPHPGAGASFWVLLSAPSELWVASKTHEFDESLLLDN
eukprot:6498545-Pyramimonas_sp.AAC.1